MNSFDLVKAAVKALDDKHGVDIQVIGVRELTILGDYFVIAGGSSTTQVKALADEVEYQLGQAGVKPNHIEGRATGWIVLDYGSVVVHVFYGEQRAFYELERLWKDGEVLDASAFLEKQEG